MSSPLVVVVLGVLSLLWLRLYVPRAMKRIQRSQEKRGQPTERFEMMLDSTRYRLAIGAMTIASTAAIVLGVVSLATE
jgi:predicted MFS family arabinose efflux permease